MLKTRPRGGTTQFYRYHVRFVWGFAHEDETWFDTDRVVPNLKEKVEFHVMSSLADPEERRVLLETGVTVLEAVCEHYLRDAVTEVVAPL
jgi:hypothetical protein